MATTNAAATRSETGEPRTGQAAADDAQGGRLQGARHTAEQAAAGLSGAAGTVSARLPEAAATTRTVIDDAARAISTGSDEMLTVGTSFSLGVAIGMLVGGANRILVTLALIPAAAMGMTLLDRNSTTGKGRRAGA